MRAILATVLRVALVGFLALSGAAGVTQAPEASPRLRAPKPAPAPKPTPKPVPMPMRTPNPATQTRVIVQYTLPASTNDTVAPEPEVQGAELVTSAPFLGLEIFSVDLTVTTAAAACAEFLAYPYVQECDPDQQQNFLDATSATPDDPQLAQQWALTTTASGAEDAWKEGLLGSQLVRVCVIDTGADLTHPDLAANLWVNPGEVAGNGVDDDKNGVVDDVNGASYVDGAITGDPQDDNGHGTFVHGVIAAVTNNKVGIAGVSQLATLIPCKFMDADGNGATSDAILCLNYCLQENAHVIHNSWGTDAYTKTLELAVGAATARGVLVVASAGNTGTDTDSIPHYPSGLSQTDDGVLSVAAHAQNGELWFGTCYGKTSVQLAAPGAEVLGLDLGGGYTTLTGTSMAAPHVSGSAALLLAYTASKGFDLNKTRGAAQALRGSIANGTVQGSAAFKQKVPGGRLYVPKALAALEASDYFLAGPAGQLSGGTSGSSISGLATAFIVGVVVGALGILLVVLAIKVYKKRQAAVPPQAPQETA